MVMNNDAYNDFQAYGRWCSSFYDAIEQAIKECISNNHWDENHISYSWIQEARKCSASLSLRNFPRPVAIAWNAFKSRGALETKFGDIAFLVDQTFENGKKLSGVAFLEAKRNYDSSFDKLDPVQLKTQIANTSSHRLLLYDTEQSVTPTLFLAAFPYLHRCHHRFLYECYCDHLHYPHTHSHATVIPTQHALAFGCKSRSLHKLSVPLWHQITGRYFLGQDLDYNQETVTKVRNGSAQVLYLIAVSISFGELVDAGAIPIPLVDAYQPFGDDNGQAI
jgi:hypothetical protein